MKISIVGVKARDKALKGANYVADAVKSTLGPFGLNALIEKGNRITNDGCTISRELCGAITDEYERLGAVTLHQASNKTNDQVGDATSTSEVLAQVIVKEAIKYLPNETSIVSKKTPSEILKMIESSKKEVIEKLEAMKMDIKSEEEIIASARVSVEDEELAKLIGSAQWGLGEDGFILAEETAELKSSVENVKGIRIDNGFGTSVIINNQEKQLLEVDDCAVILTNYTMGDLMSVKDTIEQLVKMKRTRIAIVSRGFTPECIRICLENHKSGVFIYPINAPYTDQAEIMRDLASVLGGRYIDTEEGRLEDINISDVGHAEKIIARRYDAILTGPNNEDTNALVNKRILQLEDKLKGAVSDFEKKNLQSRISQLTNGFAILKVGADTELTRKYKKDKCDDAVNAVRLAYKGGVVKGAGLAFKEISESLEEGNILKKPLLAINDQIMSSAPEGFVVEEWVRDPFLVLKCALENACSVAGVFATTNITICEENKKYCKHEEN